MTHVIVWEFRVRAGHEAVFEAVYGAGGDWARLFAKSPDHRGTELLRDASTPGRYLTIDRWASAEAFGEFRRARKGVRGSRRPVRSLDGGGGEGRDLDDAVNRTRKAARA
jgi:heme-degrading monooxygenase HmoA